MLQERRLFPRLQRNIRQQASIKDKTVHDNVLPKQTPLTDKTQSPSSKKNHPTLIGKHSLRNKQPSQNISMIITPDKNSTQLKQLDAQVDTRLDTQVDTPLDTRLNTIATTQVNVQLDTQLDTQLVKHPNIQVATQSNTQSDDSHHTPPHSARSTHNSRFTPSNDKINKPSLLQAFKTQIVKNASTSRRILNSQQLIYRVATLNRMETIPEHSAFSLSREYTNLNSFTAHKIFAQKLTPSGANTFLCKVDNRNTKIWLPYTQLDKNAQNYILMNDIPEAGKQLRAKYNKQVFSINTQDCPSDVINKQLLSFTHKCVPYTCIDVPINANNA